MTEPVMVELGQDAVHEMIGDLEDAQTREADYASRLESARRSRAESEATTALLSAPGSIPSSAVNSEPCSQAASKPSSPGGSQVPLVNVTLHDYVVPLVQSRGKWVESKQLPPPDSTAWTLTTYVSPSLRRRDFESSDDAWAAFGAEEAGP